MPEAMCIRRLAECTAEAGSGRLVSEDCKAVKRDLATVTESHSPHFDKIALKCYFLLY